MGKKSRRNRGSNPNPNPSPNPTHSDQPVATNAAPCYYPSDGPSDVELLQTTSSSLQNKLDQLTKLGLENNRKEFVENFVPLDLTEMETSQYLEDLTVAEEAEGQWTNLISEIAAIRCGKGVDRIEGDQINRAIFFFQHPLIQNCDREVSFACINGEWRAEG